MSRCGSCPLYWDEKYGVSCPGNQGIEDCSSALQDLYYAISAKLEKPEIAERKLYDNDGYRDEFMNAVYEILADDCTNDRANQIIALFDNAPSVKEGS